ncbi:MAG: ABC transporter substrate-binding protein [Leptospirales bacterium]|nr:ABC transporter substrate-binding protein [Leptospirales bacterium]
MKKFLAITICLFAISVHAQEEAEQKVLAPIKRLIGNVRYSDKAKTLADRIALEDRALESIGSTQMAEFLMGDYAKTATPAQKEKFAKQIREYTRYKAFPLIHKYFKDIDLTYEPPVINGDQARVQSSVVYSGSERLTFSWILTKVGENYVITDFLNDKNTSSMQSNKVGQVQPTLKEKGVPGLLSVMDNAVAQVKKAAGR